MNIPGYKIQRTLGKGGMATVFLAIQQSLDRPVALKVLDPAFSYSEEFAKRFVNEARLIASLHHANIITIHDAGAAKPHLYIAMEYVQGGDLRRRIAQGISPQEALQLIETLGACLKIAHEKGIVHRDVKPANILFRTDGTPLLTDFGIAKQLSQQKELTRTGTVLGSPYYLSPEQAKGGAVDGRADIYSLGIILYELLAGRKPYEGDSDVSTILMHVQEPIPRLPTPLETLQPLIDHMLAKDPAKRFEDVSGMGAQIRAARHSLSPALARFREGPRRDEAVADDAPTLVLHNGTGGRRFKRVGLGLGLAVVAAAALLLTPTLRQSLKQLTGADTADGTHVVAPDSSRVIPDKKNGPQQLSRADVAGANAAPLTKDTIESLSQDGQKPPSETEAKLQEAEREEALREAKRQEALRRAEYERAEREKALQRAKRAALRRRVKTLLAKANSAFSRDKLTTPLADNAYHYYQAVLELDPSNRTAKRGVHNIASRYATLAQHHINKYGYARANRLIDRGLKVEPNNPRLLALREQAELKNAPEQAWRDLKSIFR